MRDMITNQGRSNANVSPFEPSVSRVAVGLFHGCAAVLRCLDNAADLRHFMRNRIRACVIEFAVAATAPGADAAAVAQHLYHSRRASELAGAGSSRVVRCLGGCSAQHGLRTHSNSKVRWAPPTNPNRAPDPNRARKEAALVFDPNRARKEAANPSLRRKPGDNEKSDPTSILRAPAALKGPRLRGFAHSPSVGPDAHNTSRIMRPANTHRLVGSLSFSGANQ